MENASATSGRPGLLVRTARRARRWRRTGGEVLRGEGPTRLLARVAVVAGGAAYRHVIFFALDLSRPLPVITTDVPVDIRLLRVEDVDAYSRFRAGSTYAASTLRRLEKGDLCVAAWLEGEIVSAGWVSFGTGRLAEVGRRLSLAADEAYVYDSYTVERLRGHSVAAVRTVWAAAYLRAAGYRRTLSCISPQNRPAFGPPRKVGHQRLGNAGFIRLGPLRRDFVQPVGGRRRWASRREPIVFDRDLAVVLPEDRSLVVTGSPRAVDRTARYD